VWLVWSHVIKRCCVIGRSIVVGLMSNGGAAVGEVGELESRMRASNVCGCVRASVLL
jgi:hypothetical protein